MNRRHIVFALQAAGSAMLLTLLFRSFDWEKFSEVIGHMSLAFYVGSLAAAIAGQFMVTFRWQVMLSSVGARVGFGEVLRQGLIGQFFSSFLPTAVGGDAVKVYYLGRNAGYVEVGASVFLDRFLGFLWLAVIGASLAWITGANSDVLVLNRNLLTFFAVLLSAITLATLLPVERVLALVVPARWAATRLKLGEFIGCVRIGAVHPVALVTALLVALAFNFMMAEVYRVYFRANGLPAVPVLPLMMVIMSMAILANVPLSVNGIGLREQLHVLLLAGFGVPREVSVLISLLLFSHNLLFGLAGWFLWMRFKPSAVHAL